MDETATSKSPARMVADALGDLTDDSIDYSGIPALGDDFFTNRKGKSNREAFRRLLTRQGGEPPQSGDEMPADRAR